MVVLLDINEKSKKNHLSAGQMDLGSEHPENRINPHQIHQDFEIL
jgi:hypothetical protein